MKKTEPRGKVFVLSAPSGAGKTTLINKIKDKFKILEESISCTTRNPREGEIDGVDYFFMGKDDFLEKKSHSYFLETAEVHGSLYGTPKHYIESKLAEGSFLICDVDVQGALNIKNEFPREAVLIFVLPPSMEELRRRLEKRALDKKDVIEKRLQNAKNEISYYHYYNYIIVNDKIENAESLLTSILEAEIDGSILKNIDIIRRFD